MSDTKRKWCAMLAKLTSPMNPEDAAKGFVNMLPLLPQDDAAYNRDTLELAARRETGDPAVPNFDMLSRAFAKWNRDKRPASQKLGANPEVLRIAEAFAPRPPATPEACQHVDDLLAAYKAEVAGRPPCIIRETVTPKHLSKLELALSAPQEVLSMRPDLRAALAEHEGQEA